MNPIAINVYEVNPRVNVNRQNGGWRVVVNKMNPEIKANEVNPIGRSANPIETSVNSVKPRVVANKVNSRVVANINSPRIEGLIRVMSQNSNRK